MTISTWNPLSRQVSSISRANPAVVTTTVPHNFLAGTIVGFFFPLNLDYGMNFLSSQTYVANILTNVTFSIPVNTSASDAFISTVDNQVVQVYPAGETANTLANRERNTLTPVGGPSP